MINIYLCDDDLDQVMLWKKVVENTLIIEDLKSNMTLRCATTNPNEILSLIGSNKDTGLYFLDIQFGTNANAGLTLAQDIRRLDPAGYIVFITTHDNMAAITYQYKVAALDFIIKDDPQQIHSRIYDCMKTALENYQLIHSGKDNLLTMKVGGNYVRIKQDEILYIHSSEESHKVDIHTVNGIHQVPGTLSSLDTLLNSLFWRCEKSTIVNSAHVQCMDAANRKLVMDNGEECMISFRGLKEAKKRFDAS